MKVLYIGGTGQISFDCVHESVRQGHEVWVFNRGHHNQGLPPSVNHLQGDIQDDECYRQIADMQFDVICQFRVFTPEQMKRDIEFFADCVGQYIFISSASAYQKPLPHYLITEEMPLSNPYAQYSQNKAECEFLLQKQDRLPFTIVRPSHTSRSKITTAMGEGYIAAWRILHDKPVVIPGDGTNLWVVTAAQDFAPPFVRLLGNQEAINQHFHLTSDNVYTWNQIYAAIANALGKELQAVHVPSDTLIKYNPKWQGALLGDKSYSVVFDNSKIKSVIGDFRCDTSLEEFMNRLIEKFHQRGGAYISFDGELDALFDRIIAEQSALGD